MDFRNVYNYYFRNTTTNDIPATFTSPKPDMLKNQLQKKKLRVQKFFANNLSVPLFVPDRMINTNTYTTFTVPDAVSNVFVNNTLTVNSLDYFITLKKIDLSVATTIFIQHTNVNNTITPNNVIIDDYQYYTNKYYYYYDFTHFLSIIKNAIATLLPALAPIVWMNNDSYFQLFIDTLAIVGYYIEFSPKLINLLPFKNIPTSYGTNRLVFSEEIATINSNSYYEVDAIFYDTIFPFTQLLFTSDNLGLNPIHFLDNSAFKSNIQTGVYENAILSYDIGTDQITKIQNFFKYVNENDTIWCNFQQDRSSDQLMTIKIFLRFKNNILIPYTLKPNELFTFSLEVVYND